MKIKLRTFGILYLLISVLLLSACSHGQEDGMSETEAATEQTDEAGIMAGGDMAEMTGTYETITGEAAKQLMDSETDYIILDVRRQDEFDNGHIPDAVLIPLDELSERAEQELPQKDQLILVYCRSGNRSAQAAELLAGMGYTNVKDFGGIMDWEYEVITE